jgi:hypothetical protein
MAVEVRHGVSQYDGGMMGAGRWYGWAGKPGPDGKIHLEQPGQYVEGATTFFKWKARFDAWRLARRMAR